jgi:hypothetical protein
MTAIVYLLGFGHIAICSCLILYTRETVAAVIGYNSLEINAWH